MFLLILMMESQQQKSFHTLNSIMFLLIRDCGIYCSFVKNFKFHYVSINSSPLFQSFSPFSGFKFHYVSINSYWDDQEAQKIIKL